MAYEKDGEIILIKKTATGKDSRGRPIYAEERKEVLAKISTTTQNEFFTAGQRGLQAEWVFKIDPVMYNRETIAIYEGVAYRIYRKYQPEMDTLELYAATEVGLNEQFN